MINRTMQLSQKAIDEFKQIYQQEFGKGLNDEEANKKGLELLNFFKLIYRPIPKNENEKRYIYTNQ